MDEMVKKVQDEIKSLGDNTKKIYDGLRNDYEELKHSIENKADAEKIEKLVTSVSTRQEELDKKINKRIDEFEVAAQRLPGSQESKEALYNEAKQFNVQRLAIKSGVDGVKYNQLTDVNVEEFVKYREALIDFFRKAGDERLMSPEQYKLLQVGIDPDGGYLVTPQMSSRILQRLFESDPVRQLANVQSITSDALEETVDWGDAGAAWEEETVASTDSTTPTWYKKKISVHSLGTRPKATQNLLEDAAINVETWLAGKIANRFARTEGAAFVSGNGVGKPRGFLTYGTGTTYGTVEQIAMGHASALTADGFISIKYGMKEDYIGTGTWLMNRTTLAAAMKLKDGNGDYLWKPGMLANDPYSTLLGLTVRMSTTMPAVTTNSLSVVLADWARAYTIVDRLGITVLRDPYTVKPLIEFYTRKRVGGDIVDFDAIKIGKIAAS